MQMIWCDNYSRCNHQIIYDFATFRATGLPG
jgi:hypothetical protein